jgi:hypothetical protein
MEQRTAQGFVNALKVFTKKDCYAWGFLLLAVEGDSAQGGD